MSKGLILVTGSSGFIGGNVCERFKSLGYDVVGFDQEGAPYPPKDVEWVFADLTSDASVQEAFQIVEERHGLDVAAVVHLAAYYSFKDEHSPLYEKLTVQGTERILRELQRFNCEQFIFSSTILVHAPSVGYQPINEDSPVVPKWDYPKSKVETENLIRQKRGNIRSSVILRIAGVYDDEWCRSIPISEQIRRIYEHRMTSHFFSGDLKHGQSFVDIADLIDCFVLAVEKRKELPQELTLLIGEPETYSYEQLQDEIAKDLFEKNHWLTEAIPKPLAKAGAWVENRIPGTNEFIKPWMIDFGDDEYVVDISRARRHLGWDPKHRLIDAIPQMVADLKRDPVQFYKVNHMPLPSWLKTDQKRAA